MPTPTTQLPSHADGVILAERFLRVDVPCRISLIEPKVPGVVEIVDNIGWDRRGLSTVIEFKAFLSDLRADELKPFRTNGLGMGVFRYYLFADGSDVRPEHVDEGSGWGVMVYYPTTEQIRIVMRAQAWNDRYINHAAEKLLLCHALNSASRAAGGTHQERREQTKGHIPKVYHEAVTGFITHNGPASAKEVARMLATLMPGVKPGTLAKYLATDARAGLIPNVTATGTPAQLSLSA